MKIKITSNFLLREYRSTVKIILFAIFVLAGLFCVISSLLYFKTLETKLAATVMSLFIAIPFCWVGLKNIINIINQNRALKNDNYIIIEDVVVKKHMLHHGTSKNTSDSYCQLDFETHSKNTGKAVVVKRSVYEETKKGDSFYLVYVNEKLIGFYPTSRYELP